jgi:hypothetical protein
LITIHLLLLLLLLLPPPLVCRCIAKHLPPPTSSDGFVKLVLIVPGAVSILVSKSMRSVQASATTAALLSALRRSIPLFSALLLILHLPSSFPSPVFHASVNLASPIHATHANYLSISLDASRITDFTR